MLSIGTIDLRILSIIAIPLVLSLLRLYLLWTDSKMVERDKVLIPLGSNRKKPSFGDYEDTQEV